jgi:SAM-dependent methyltransferase
MILVNLRTNRPIEVRGVLEKLREPFKRKQHLEPTRGWGLLESFLARQRSRMANRLIDPQNRKGTLVDVGCGPLPTFLLGAEFSFKIGIDKVAQFGGLENHNCIAFIRWDIECNFFLPLASQSCDTITMLAVLEHVSSSRSLELLREIDRILKPGGTFVVTTPAAWTGGLLFALAKMKLVSSEEIHDHKVVYTREKLENLLRKAFPLCETLVGPFEGYMNLWGAVRKPPN